MAEGLLDLLAVDLTQELKQRCLCILAFGLQYISKHNKISDGKMCHSELMSSLQASKTGSHYFLLVSYGCTNSR